MDESKLIDWYDVAEAVANGRLEGHVCPLCGASPLQAQRDGANVRVRCASCGEGVEGRLAHGRDDAFDAEVAAMERRRAASCVPQSPRDGPPGGVCASIDELPNAESSTHSEPPSRSQQPDDGGSSRGAWQWQLPSRGGNDWEGYAMWAETVEAVYNGRRTGLLCPFCSEALDNIVFDDPHLRVSCAVCGEGFEGRIG